MPRKNRQSQCGNRPRTVADADDRGEARIVEGDQGPSGKPVGAGSGHPQGLRRRPEKAARAIRACVKGSPRWPSRQGLMEREYPCQEGTVRSGGGETRRTDGTGERGMRSLSQARARGWSCSTWLAGWVHGAHAWCPGAYAVQMRSCWISALARTRSFRITAVRATFGGFPLATRAAYVRLRSAHPVPATLDEAASLPGSGLPSHRGESGEAGGTGPGERAQFGHVDDQSCGGDVGDAGDGDQDLGLALQSLLCPEPFPDLGVNALQLALDLLQPLLVELLGHGGAQVLAAVGDGDPVRDQRIADQLEFGKVALPFGLRLSRAQILDGRRHGSQHPGVHGIGLGAPAERAGEKDRTWYGLIA